MACLAFSIARARRRRRPAPAGRSRRCGSTSATLAHPDLPSTGSIDRPEAGLAQDALDPRAIAEGILAGILRPRPRLGGRNGCAARIGTAPQGFSCGVRQADEDQPARRLQRAADVAEGGDRIAEEHHAEAREDEIERRRPRKHGSSHRRPRRSRCQAVARAPPRPAARKCRRPAHARRADRLGKLGRRAAGAAADIEHALARLRVGGRERRSR